MFGVGERKDVLAPARAAISEHPAAAGRMFSARRTRGYGIALDRGNVSICLAVSVLLRRIADLVLHSTGIMSRGSRYGSDSGRWTRLDLSVNTK